MNISCFGNQLKKIKGLCCIILSLLLLVSCASTAPQSQPAYNTAQPASVGSGVVAENVRFQLLWDDSSKCIFLYEKSSGKIWCSIPYDYYQKENGNDGGLGQTLMTSPIIVDYIEPTNQEVKTIYGSTGAIQNGRVGCTKIDNGIEVTYYFDSVKISVPVDYILRQDSLEAKVDVGRITESKNLVYQISLLPFLASAKDNTDSYLFVPSGSGALMYTDQGTRNARTFSDETYGTDPSSQKDLNLQNSEPIRLPVFGVKDNKNALMGIVEKGSECSLINAQAGSVDIGYSSVYPVFRVRGCDSNEIPNLYGTKTLVYKYSKKMTGMSEISVGYYPLDNGDANYSGMARLYRNYLVQNMKMAANCSNPQLYLEILGGALIKTYFLGIPYSRLEPATTFSQAQTVISQLYSLTRVKPVVKLSGYGDSGLDIGNVAGGFQFSNALGGLKGFKSLSSYCQGQGISLFTDFNLEQFRKSGKGFSTLFNSVVTASNVTAHQYFYSVENLSQRTDTYRYELLKRGSLPAAAQKLVSAAAAMNVKNISVSTLSNLAYSDFTQQKYYQKGNMATDVGHIVETFHENGDQVMACEANDYAAAVAAQIAGSPTKSGQYDSLDQDIPFYQMVFKGYVPISVSPINLAQDPEDQFLKAIETGCGLYFSLSYSYSSGFQQSSQDELLASQYQDNEKMIADMVKASSSYFNLIRNAKILDNKVLSKDVLETDFDNQVKVYVNFSDKAVDTPIGKLEPQSFAYKA